MTEYTLQIPNDILCIIQQVAEKNNISVNQFLLIAAKNSLATALTEIDESLPLDKQPLNWGNCLQIARSLEVKGPPDWSENIDDYLYGEKRDK